jgi:hypothetical protein
MFVGECVLVYVQVLPGNTIQLVNDLDCNLDILIKYTVDKKCKNFSAIEPAVNKNPLEFKCTYPDFKCKSQGRLRM